MNRLELDLAELRTIYGNDLVVQVLPSGARLIEIRNYTLPDGWSEKNATLIFVAPAGFPGAQPDCFWIEPRGLRLVNGSTPQASNDSNPIPEIGQRGTWFSWHVQAWNPNRDSLLTYLRVIDQRLEPAR